MCSVPSTLTIDDKYNDTKKYFCWKLINIMKYYNIFLHTTSTLLRNGSISHFLYSSSLHCLHLHCGVIKETWGQPYCFRGVNKVRGVISKKHFYVSIRDPPQHFCGVNKLPMWCPLWCIYLKSYTKTHLTSVTSRNWMRN